MWLKICIDRNIIKQGQRILEVGAGNLRNSLAILKSFPDINIYCYDLEPTKERFSENYKEFKKLGGHIVSDA